MNVLSREVIDQCIREEKERTQRAWSEPRPPLLCSPMTLRSICRTAVSIGVALEREYQIPNGYMAEARDYVRGRDKRRARMARKKRRGWA